MANLSRNFIKGKMNKSLDERLVPNGEYVDALNVRLGSTEDSEIGSVENSKGNDRLTTISFEGQELSANARCIGAYEEGENETLYWFVHDPSFANGATGKLDMICSYDTKNGILTYHVISIDDGNGANTTLNFDTQYLITGVNLIGDLLFFTDNLNPPRFINILKTYTNPIANVDQFSAEEILVIKKPPLNSPGIVPLATTSDNNYLEDRFVSFGYRYKYADSEYSATSQFSNPSFIPKPFDFTTQNYLNEGMINSTNVVEITYNSGGPLVVGVDLLFKDMNSGTIKVIEKLDKADLGLANDTDYTYTFSNSKIFTILSDSEILRLYDNVPLLAQAQTLMGNRLMYGNYVEGYDLIDKNLNEVKLEYTLNLVTEDIGLEEVPSATSSGVYTVDGNQTIPNSVFSLDFNGIDLVEGAVLSFSIQYEHQSFSSTSGSPLPTDTTSQTTIDFDYFLQQNFATPYDLAQDSNFRRRIGELIALTSGTNTAVVVNELVDAGTDFTLAGVAQDDLVTNNSTVPSTSSTVTGVAANNLTLTDDIFQATPEQYTIYTYDSIRNVDAACDGGTLTDAFNCSVITTLDTYTKDTSGVDTLPQPIKIGSSIGSSEIFFQLPAMRFVDGADEVFEYYQINIVEAEYQKAGNPKSLHSNRGYEIGIIYMDDFNRASTALVSENNNISVPCSNSELANRIRVTIPTQQLAPAWATRYKFCIKPDKELYETIYTNLFFNDAVGGAKWFILEGENTRKVEVGDELIVKTDTNGPVNRCITATVLDKEAKEADFITPLPEDSNGNEISIPAATYMKMRPNNFSTEQGDLPVVAPGKQSKCRGKSGKIPFVDISTPSVANPEFDPSQLVSPTNSPWVEYDIPAGSRISIEFEALRRGRGNACEKRQSTLEVVLTASQDYANFRDWWIGDNVEGILNTGTNITDNPSECVPENVFDPTLYTSNDGAFRDVVQGELCKNFWFFWQDVDVTSNTYGQMRLVVSGTKACASTDRKRSCVNINVTVVRSDSFLVFETQPQDASPDIWYESSVSYPIDQSTGFHFGNEQDQNAVQPAVILTEFFNCFAFGNGVESYKIKDSLVGKPLELGNRVTSTSALDYQRIRRFADITYSGVFNDESNVNKLNEFNLGLLNFKPLEDDYGPITLLDGRETDILVLQEDKISYVLTGKNLLSDSTGGGSVSSVPEVLGTQIARLEEFGNSNNPESFAKYGYNKYFTDAKRGAVLQLKGSSAQNEQLNVISEFGMRSYFRDLFATTFNTQKLGGFDPYMNEYVLSTTGIDKPAEEVCIACGQTRVINVSSADPSDFCVEVGGLVGDVTVSWNVTSASGSSQIDATYDGITTSSGQVGLGAGSFIINKDKVSDEQIDVTLSTLSGIATIEITVSCPDAQEITIVQVCVNSDNHSGELTHTEYRWTDGVYVSPLHSTQVSLLSGTGLIISQYNTITAQQGAGIIPADNADVSILSNKIIPSGDDFQFDPAQHDLMYLRSNTLYANNQTDVLNLIAAATSAAPITGGPDVYQGDFTMPPTNDQYLYLIWDLRDKTQIDLCLSLVDAEDACCNCDETAEEYLVRLCTQDTVNPPQDFVVTSTISLTPGEFVNTDLDPDCVYIVIGTSTDPSVGNVTGIATGFR